MSIATASFTLVPKGPDGTVQMPVAAFLPGELLNRWERSNAWQPNVKGSLENFKGALRASMLSADPCYPAQDGLLFKQQLAWHEGLTVAAGALRDGAAASLLELTFDRETCELLIELLPLDSEGKTWLDNLGPIQRNIGWIARKPMPRSAPGTVAILYESSHTFEACAQQLCRNLLPCSTSVDLYHGGQFRNEPMRLLKEIFGQHSVVLFVGNLTLPDDKGRRGWRLDGDLVLTMEFLANFFGLDEGLLRRPGGFAPSPGLAVPDLVFACCCDSAGCDRDCHGAPKLPYPSLFLEAGVNYYIGTGAKFWLSEVDKNAQGLTDFLEEFLRLWLGSPAHAEIHLYEAKKKFGFNLCNAIFQVYRPSKPTEEMIYGNRASQLTGKGASVSPEAAARTYAPVPAAKPHAAMLTAISAGDVLGGYVLEQELWWTESARTFSAHVEGSSGLYLVQVLTDESQGSPQIEEKLAGALSRLHTAPLGEGHLVPDRSERVDAFRAGELLFPGVLILVYARPAVETAETWTALRRVRVFDDLTQHYAQVLTMGMEISQSLAVLHGHGLFHGNLEPGSIVFRRDADGNKLVLKDAWLRHVRGSRHTAARYGAPEEVGASEHERFLEADCWGLGVILYELTCGRPFAVIPEDADSRARQNIINRAIGQLGENVPSVLRAVIRECLIPSARIRPTAKAIWRRLWLGLTTGGTAVTEFEEVLDAHIQAGHRLFYIPTEDAEEIESVLRSFASRSYPRRPAGLSAPRERVGYRLYGATREGVVMFTEHETPAPCYAPSDELRPGFSPEEASWAVLCYALSLSPSEGRIPVVSLSDTDWWRQLYPAPRLLKSCQQGAQNSPAVVLTGVVPPVWDSELARSFVGLPSPLPTPAGLFEFILAFPQTHQADVAEIGEELAVELAMELYPSSYREVRQALRMCALKHGTIDLRALDAREEERESEFRRFPQARYTRASHLPRLEEAGLSRGLEARLEEYCGAAEHAPSAEAFASVPRRLLITGPEGSGKAVVARAVAARLRRPLIALHTQSFLRDELGESEDMLRKTCRLIAACPGSVVLLERVEQFTEAFDDDTGLMRRLGGILRRWIEAALPGQLVAITAGAPDRLPPEWKRLIDLEIVVPDPQVDVEYRGAILAAAFRKFGLPECARDGELIAQFVRATVRDGVALPVPSAFGRCTGRAHAIPLKTRNDIEHWVKETLLLFGGRGNPAVAEFWRAALAGKAQP